MRKQLLLSVISPLFFLLFSSCVDYFGAGYPPSYLYRFSVENNSNSDVTVQLTVGEIPSPTARYDELTPVSDSIYSLIGSSKSYEDTSAVIKRGDNGGVYTLLPIAGLGSPGDDDDETYTTIREELLDKLFSFILTISRNGRIVYRVVGWDVPDEDMEKYNITDDFFGYYNTAEESYMDYVNGHERSYPLLYSKLWSSGIEADFVDSLIYFIKVTPESARLQDFNPWSQHIDEDNYWRDN